jgi:uncharacterized protein YkwD
MPRFRWNGILLIILNFISRSSLDSFLLPKGDIISMSRNLPRRAFVGQIAFWPLMARRAMVNQTYTYNTLPAGYTYVTQPQAAEAVAAQPAAPVETQLQPAPAQAAAPAQPVAYDYGDGGVLATMNAQRAAVGLHALAYCPNLSASANGVASNCAARNALVHSNLGMENLAMTPVPANAIGMWVNSPGHRANMFSGATRVGIGLASNGSYWYVAAIFG